MKTIEVVVTPEGKTEVETKGYSGTECLKAADDVERALGKRGRIRATQEAYAQPATKAVKQ